MRPVLTEIRVFFCLIPIWALLCQVTGYRDCVSKRRHNIMSKNRHTYVSFCKAQPLATVVPKLAWNIKMPISPSILVTLTNGGLRWNRHKSPVQEVYRNISIIKVLNSPSAALVKFIIGKIVAAVIIDQWLQKSWITAGH
jgi:hypothetical protein